MEESCKAFGLGGYNYQANCNKWATQCLWTKLSNAVYMEEKSEEFRCTMCAVRRCSVWWSSQEK